MALNTPPLPRPEYLKDVTTENAENNRISGALNIFKSGRLSNAPCRSCVEANADCIVASTVAGKCMLCAYKSKANKECSAEGVKNSTEGSETIPHPTLPLHNVPRPEYLQGVTLENYGDHPTGCALRIYMDGKLSPKPCRLCVEANEVCIVSPKRASRCMRCVYIDTRTVECLAEAVAKSFEVSHLETSPETGNPILPAQFAPSVRASAATQESKVTMSQPDTQVADKSDSTVEAKSIVVGTVDLQGHNDPGVPTQQKRKRRAAETLDTSSELPAKRPCRTRIAVVTGHPFAPNARRATGYSSPLVFEHPYAPTAPGATGRISTPVFEHPYAPTAPRPTNHTSGLTSVAYATEDNVNVRYAPINSHDYNLRMRTTDPAAWTQWAYDLHKELHTLRHVQDLGPYTMGVIAMMKEDGVWPTRDMN